MKKTKFPGILAALFMLALLSACHSDTEMSEDWWCSYYGTCKKEASAMCSFYGNCPDSAKGSIYGTSSSSGSSGSVWGSGVGSGSGTTAPGFGDSSHSE